MEDKTNNRLGINHIKRVKNTNDFYLVQWNFRRFLVNWHPEFKELAFEKAIRAIESLMRKRETNSNYVWNLSVSGVLHNNQ